MHITVFDAHGLRGRVSTAFQVTGTDVLVIASRKLNQYDIDFVLSKAQGGVLGGQPPREALTMAIGWLVNPGTRLRRYVCSECGQKIRAASDTLDARHFVNGEYCGTFEFKGR